MPKFFFFGKRSCHGGPFFVEPIFYTHNIMKHFTYTTKGTCSRLIDIELNDDNTIGNVAFAGGCHGNLQGISSLIKGQKAEDVIARLKGIECGSKGTSCPDQLAIALEEAIGR